MLYWVDISKRQILRARDSMGTVETWDLPSEPGCIAPAASGGLVMALRNGVFRGRRWGAALEHIATLPYDPAQMRANDGKCDVMGRFWIGTIDDTKAAGNAALYSLDCRTAQTPLLERKTDPATLPATTANGLAWSPAGDILYWADSQSHSVQAWHFDAPSGALTQRRTVHQFTSKPALWQFEADQLSSGTDGYGGRPDGAAVDLEGNYFLAMYEGRRVCKLAPDGRLLAEWATPAQCPTMPCFGGADLRTLYLTTARQKRGAAELAALPLSGHVFSMRVAVAGLPVNFFID
jgi:sugar lactone lactonase YvrE